MDCFRLGSHALVMHCPPIDITMFHHCKTISLNTTVVYSFANVDRGLWVIQPSGWSSTIVRYIRIYRLLIIYQQSMEH